jgi:methionyl-tRNA synthetase
MFYITTPIPYSNGEPHLGHLLEHIVTDTIARYRQRVESQQVFLQMGIDQHGLKIQQKAEELNVPVRDFVRQKAESFQELWAKYSVSPTAFVETSSDDHILVAQLIFEHLFNKGYIYQKSYTGFYCVGCEDFYTPSQLDEKGNCPIHLTKPIEMSEQNYFFKLSAFSEVITEHLQTASIRPETEKQQWTNFVNEGLQDISISRDKSKLQWGVPILLDNHETNQVMYVWFEALINYFTAIINPETLDRFRELPLQKEEFLKEVLDELKIGLPIDFLYCGKDIAKFHLVIFVGILSALKLPLPKYSLVHGLINDTNGHKFSKSLGNGIYPADLETKFGVDGTRFILLHEVNTTSDTNFDWQKITESYNACLANNLGNVIMRVSTLLEKYFPEFDIIDFDENEMIQDEKLDTDFRTVYKYLDSFDCQRAMQEFFMQIAKLNVYLEETKPWTLAKDMPNNGDRIKQILGQSALILLESGKVLSIFLPESGTKIVEIFNSIKIVKAPVLFPKVELTEKI